ncbi:MAG: glycoside hydrolase family 3 protein [Terriglobia bacterium]
MRTTVLICCVAFGLTPLAFIRTGSQRPASADETHPWVEQTLAQMTLEEKVGQMIVPGLDAIFTNQAGETFQEIDRNLTRFHVGGYHAFGGDPAALALLLNRMQQRARIPLLITADLEGGPGYEFRGATRLPRAMALAATRSEELAYQAGKIAAVEGRALGIGVNFYPVVDVNNNPRNPIINIRSFGEDPALVARMARAYIRGAQENGQLATAKHFPGHGDTRQDSHLELPVIDVGRDRLNQIELPPFRAAIAAGVAAVMTAHIYLPQLESETGLPATLSRAVTSDLLRGELGFEGLIFTDAMTMQGVAAHFTPEEAAVRAVQAGADMILYPVDVAKTFNALKRAVETGEIPLARIEASVRRILQAKARLGLHQNRLVDLNQLDALVGSPEHEALARSIIERALTLVRDPKNLLPLTLDPSQRVLLLTILDSRLGWREAPRGLAFARELLRRHPNTTEVQIDDMTSREAIEILKKLADASDVVIANGFIRIAAYKGSIALTQWQLDLLSYLAQLEKPVVFTLFGSPYLLSFVPDLPTYILTYEYYPEAERAALRAILGEIPFTGKLPISLPGAYPIGHGLTTPPPPH